jgi:hypothetical protein
MLGQPAADQILAASGIAALPALLPSGPRDFDALASELQPFVELYRALVSQAGRQAALAIVRQAIVDSGLLSHAAEGGDPESHADEPQPLTLTSPPAAPLDVPGQELQARFDLAMRFFSCQGTLLEYSPERVHFQVNECNWCGAMRAAGAPELIPFFCETDERFMDQHPTHRLSRPAAIGLGDACCDFRFVPIAEQGSQQEHTA